MIEPTMAGIRQALNHRGLSQFEQWWLLQQVEQVEGERDALREEIHKYGQDLREFMKISGFLVSIEGKPLVDFGWSHVAQEIRNIGAELAALRKWQKEAVPFLQDGIDACIRDGEDCDQCDTAKRLLGQS